MNAPTSAQSRRAVTAAVIGNMLEWYDFAVYAYVAAIIAKKFFPTQDEVTALRFGSPTVHSFYLIAAAVVSTAVIWTLKETAFDELA